MIETESQHHALVEILVGVLAAGRDGAVIIAHALEQWRTGLFGKAGRLVFAFSCRRLRRDGRGKVFG